MTNATAQALQKVTKATAENMSLQTTAENSQGRYRRDAAWQFVPDMSISDQKSLVADNRQPCT